MAKLLSALTLLLALTACDFNFDIPHADETFGTQNFVSAVSIIELHNVRNGEYPEDLDELEFLGNWDAIWLSAVRYEKVDNGYNLFVERGWATEPNLVFPIRFKQGLGIQATNVEWLE
ncbi:hypothetical protein QTP81_16980 [Alteromonas sp. ASW11-36]|uniref:RagB/SusD family nutrient uptake outer membrane protein n=1 Tax=Alteromonas arenosi TaxID=3055817 RepID=A0ABT7T3G5_9ALTE|nr:hypothetical protein [Alteromonas sp. ASW11-36]MDM7862304.1 hypothetical protein [Alteromonas sp. ASW11-36]